MKKTYNQEEINQLAINKDFDGVIKLINKFIVSYVKRYTFSQNELYNDLYQESLIGVYEAMNNYQLEKGNFLSFCQIHMKKNISKYLLENHKIIRIPANILYSPAYADVREEILALTKAISIETPIDEEGNITLGDTLTTEYGSEAIEYENIRINKQKVAKLLDKLTPTQKTIYEHYYGLNGKEEKTIYEIGDLLGTSYQNISYHLINVNKKLKKTKPA